VAITISVVAAAAELLAEKPRKEIALMAVVELSQQVVSADFQSTTYPAHQVVLTKVVQDAMVAAVVEVDTSAAAAAVTTLAAAAVQDLFLAPESLVH
jgi:hypothetical protein